MKTRTCVLLALALGLWPVEGSPQSAATGDGASAAALVREVRLLRQAVERLATSQALVTRLTLQHERAVRAQNAAERLTAALDAAAGSQDELKETLARVNGELAYTLHDPRRSELERQGASVRAELAERDREVTRLTGERTQAEQKAAAEQRAYQEIESSLGNLGR